MDFCGLTIVVMLLSIATWAWTDVAGVPISRGSSEVFNGSFYD